MLISSHRIIPRNPYTITNAVSEDKSGFYYRGGVDYNPPVAPVDQP